ncbi:MAG: transcriptional regulator [Nitrospira sp.]|nr:MAG: transcriptional regulator [Nitrospira sp.]
MSKTVTTRYDVAEHLRTPEEMAAYLEACLEEADGDAAFIVKALSDVARAKGMAQQRGLTPQISSEKAIQAQGCFLTPP